MDELEFRRRAYADPQSGEPDFLAAMGEEASRKDLVDELKGMDKQLHAALKVPVPEDLAERLLLRQNLQAHQETRKRHRWQLAAAASIAFAVGLSLTWLRTPADLGQHALDHMAHEAAYLHTVNEQVSLTALNTKLASFGGRFDSLPGEVHYPNYCDFQGIRSLHIVMDSDDGRITLFVMPRQDKLELPQQFSDDRYLGIGDETGQVQFAIVGNPDQQLTPVMNQVKNGYQSL